MWFKMAKTKHLTSLSDRHLCHNLYRKGHFLHPDAPVCKFFESDCRAGFRPERTVSSALGRRDILIREESIKRNKNDFGIPKWFKMRNWSYKENEE